MTPQRILGVVLLIIGVALVIIGMNASHSAADQIHNTFTGRFTDATTWYIISGIGVGVLGLLLTLFGIGGKSA
jgi:hypothetical protein